MRKSSTPRVCQLLAYAAALAMPALALADDPHLADTVRQGETQQVQIRTSTQKVHEELGVLIDELDRNGIGGDDVNTLRSIQKILGVLSDKDMDTIIQLLQQARAADNTSSARTDLSHAVVTQKTVIVKMRELLLAYQRQQELYELSIRLEQLAERQNTNLKGLVTLVRSAGRKTVSQYDDVQRGALNVQEGEEEAIRDEVGLLLGKLADIAKDADSDTAARLTKSLALAKDGKLEDSLRSSTTALKSGLPYQAGSGEKNARDRLYELAKLVIPEQDSIAKLHEAIDAVDRMTAEEQRVINQTAALDAKKPDQDTAAEIEQREGDLVDSADRTRHDIEHLAPAASDMLKSAQDKMQETRSDLPYNAPQRDPALAKEKEALAKLADTRKALDTQLAKAEQDKANGDAEAQAKALKDKIEALKQAQQKLNQSTAAANAGTAPDRAKDQAVLEDQDRALEPEAAQQSLPQVAEEIGLAHKEMDQATQSLTQHSVSEAAQPQKSAVDHLAKAEDLLDKRLDQLAQEEKELKSLEEARDKVAKLITDEHKVAAATDKAAEKPKSDQQAKADQPTTKPDQQAKADQQPTTKPDQQAKADQPTTKPDQQAKADQPTTKPDQQAKADQKPTTQPDQQAKANQPPTTNPADSKQLAQDQQAVAQDTAQTKDALPDEAKDAAPPLADAQNAMNQAQSNLNQQDPASAQQPEQQAMNDLNKAKDKLDQQINTLQKDLGQQPDPSQQLADLANALQQAQTDLANAQQQMQDAQNQQTLQQQQQQIANQLAQMQQQPPPGTDPNALQQAQQDAANAAQQLDNNQPAQAVQSMQKAEQEMQQAQQGAPAQPDSGQPNQKPSLPQLAQQQAALAEQAKQMAADAQNAAQEMQKAGQEMADISSKVTQAAADSSSGVPESAKGAAQDASKALDKGAAKASAQNGPEAQAQAQQAQEALSEAQAAVALAQQGLGAGKMPGKGPPGGPPDSGQADAGQPDNSPGKQDGMGTASGDRQNASGGTDDPAAKGALGSSAFLSLPKRDREAFLQTEKEKYPTEYGPVMEQYLRNVSNQESK